VEYGHLLGGLRDFVTPAFKLEIAKLMVDGLYSVQQACEASGAGPAAVKRRKRQYLAELAGKPLPGTQALTPEQREIQPLKQRIRQLEAAQEPQKKPAPSWHKEMR
jgi:transposase